MKVFNEIIRQSLPVLFICIFGEILAGVFLMNIENYLNVLPGILILVPAVMGTRGNILGTVSTRLTSALHLGSIYPRIRKNPLLKTNIKAGILLSILILSVFICFVSFRRNVDPDNIIIPTITTISDFTSIFFLLMSVYIVQAI